MTIFSTRLPALDRLALLLVSPMLMLGRQSGRAPGYANAADLFRRRYGVAEYEELDLFSERAALRLDLNGDLRGLSGKYATVVNIGTLEHVWDVHSAWSNSLRAVRRLGHFITFSPVAGFDGHGIHVTGARWIREFIAGNGFTVVDEWEDRSLHGKFRVPKDRMLLWLAARKDNHEEDIISFNKPQQVYKKGTVLWE